MENVYFLFNWITIKYLKWKRKTDVHLKAYIQQQISLQPRQQSHKAEVNQ